MKGGLWVECGLIVGCGLVFGVFALAFCGSDSGRKKAKAKEPSREEPGGLWGIVGGKPHSAFLVGLAAVGTSPTSRADCGSVWIKAGGLGLAADAASPSRVD